MMGKAAVALVAFCVGLFISTAAAQTAPEPDDMEDNSWRVLVKNFDDMRLNFLFGTDRHRTVRTAAELALLAPSYESHLGRNMYPNPKGIDLSSSYCSGFSRSILNDQISIAADATAWAIRNGFRSNTSLFNIVPNYDPAGAPLGGWINLIVCDARRGNVAFITNHQDAEQSNILTVGSGYLDVLSHPIGKMVIPHELAHVYQLNFMPYVRRELDEGKAIKTIREGLADAIGLRIVFEQFGTGGSLEAKQRSYLSQSGVKGYRDEHSRRMFMMRPYNLPLQLNEGSSKSLAGSATNSKGRRLINSVDAVMQKRMSYFTNGFFYHIMERYLDRPGQVHDLYRRFASTEDTLNIYPNLDAFLRPKTKVGTKGPVLGLVFAQFLTEYAEWWDFRTADKIGKTKWLRASFGKCPTISISRSVKKRSAETDFTPFAGGCINVVIEPEIAQNHPELELFVTSEDGDPDRIFLGMARIEHAGRLNYSCYERAKLRAVRGTFPCLLNPVQGDTVKKLPSLAGKKVRAFHIPPFDVSQNKARQMIRIILADVPSDLSNANSSSAEAATYRLTVGVDIAKVEGRDVPDPTGDVERGPGARSDANRNLREAQPPRLNRADGPLTPNGTQSIFNADQRAILNGDTLLPMSGDLGAADGVGQLLFSFSTSTDKTDGPELGFMATQDYFGTGEIGNFDVQAVYGFGDKIGLQDPNKPSKMKIAQNDPEALVYDVELNVCAYTAAQATAFAFANKRFDPCKDGERLTYKVENSVAFPALLPGIVSQSGTFEAGEQTEALKDYQNVRLARLGLPQAINATYDGDTGGAPSPSDNAPGNNSPSTRSQSGSGPDIGVARTCAVRDSGGSCDCSCDAKICLETKHATGVAIASETSCRLTCGKKWNQCTP